LAAGLCPDPPGELMRSPRRLSRNGGLLLRGCREVEREEDALRRGKEGEGPTSKED